MSPSELARDLDRTLFVEAGAGTGKTQSLVERVVALVRAGHAMRGIAAITFTEAAASQLRDRIRTALDAAGLSDAVHQLDEAAIATLHGFAQRILAEHPFEAGLPPEIDTLDEIQSTLAFEERWVRFLDALFTDPAHADVLLRATALGLSFDEQLRQIALIFNDHWDRLPAARIVAPVLSAIDPRPVVDALDRALDLSRHCTDASDLLLAHIESFAGLPERLAKAGDELESLHLLQSVYRFDIKAGRKDNYAPGCNIDDVHGALKEADAARDGLLARVRAEVLDHLLVAVRSFVLDAAAARRRAGRLEFHDLLVWARNLVRDHASVRAALAAQYSHLLIDEFQDTDPIQVELASAIAGDVPGKLFYVGDGKQSIYRFRRADVALFESVRDAMDAANIRELTANHRSVPGIVEWVNHAFGDLLSEPEYQPLHAVRRARGRAAPVVVMGAEGERGVNIAAIREREADDIVDAIARLCADHHLTWRDIAILMPTRTSLPQLERALDGADVAYRVASASLVWATQEVRDLLAVLRVIDDPSDQLSLVAALRAPALGCGDDDLLTYRQAGGAWHLHAPVPAALAPEHPVVTGLATLRRLHDDRWWAGVSGMVERVLRELRFFELAVATRRPRDRWRRLRWVLDQARAFEASDGGSLRDFVAWADLQADERARVKESPVPEADDDAVLIYTVHGAKGLEFPAVILTGLNRPPVQLGNLAQVHWGDTRPEAKTTLKFRTTGFDDLDAVEHVMEERERMRLLYVAATRAADHLVISVHRKYGDKKSQAAVLAAACERAPQLWRAFGPHQLVLQAPPSQSPPVVAPDAALRRREWEAERTRLIDQLAVAPVHAATSFGHDDAGDVAPWKKGRAGTAVGRAVHATLQTVDLVTGADLAAIAAAQAAAEGVDDRRDEIERLARAALDSPSVRAAVAGGRYWRELYVAAPAGDTLVEGFVDLLYDTGDGLVVVDYKTDSLRSPADVDAAAERYRLQGAAYAMAVAHTAGRPVSAVRFVFTAPDIAVEREIADLAAARAELLTLL